MTNFPDYSKIPCQIIYKKKKSRYSQELIKKYKSLAKNLPLLRVIPQTTILLDGYTPA